MRCTHRSTCSTPSSGIILPESILSVARLALATAQTPLPALARLAAHLRVYACSCVRLCVCVCSALLEQLKLLNNKACCCAWGPSEMRIGAQNRHVPKCRLAWCKSKILNNSKALSHQRDTTICDLIALSHTLAAATTMYDDWAATGFKKKVRYWVGHHYPANLDVEHMGDGSQPVVTVLAEEAEVGEHTAQLVVIPADVQVSLDQLERGEQALDAHVDCAKSCVGGRQRVAQHSAESDTAKAQPHTSIRTHTSNTHA